MDKSYNMHINKCNRMPCKIDSIVEKFMNIRRIEKIKEVNGITEYYLISL